MFNPVTVARYGSCVFENHDTEKMRKDNCMCLNCARMRPGQVDHCNLAARFYEICKEGGCAFILTRCAHWKAVDSAARS